MKALILGNVVLGYAKAPIDLAKIVETANEVRKQRKTYDDYIGFQNIWACRFCCNPC